MQCCTTDMYMASKPVLQPLGSYLPSCLIRISCKTLGETLTKPWWSASVIHLLLKTCHSVLESMRSGSKLFVFEIPVLIAHVTHIGDRKVLSFHFLYQIPSKFNKQTQVIVLMLQSFFYLDNQLTWWSVDSMLSVPICCFVCLLITPTSLLWGSPA